MTDRSEAPEPVEEAGLEELVFGSDEGEDEPVVPEPEARSGPSPSPRARTEPPSRPLVSPSAAPTPARLEWSATPQELDNRSPDRAADSASSARIGIAGGRETGKSYLFQSMVYRTQAGERSGSLAYFLERDSIALTSATGISGRHRSENLEDFLRGYESWRRLAPTTLGAQHWYRLRLGYRCGLLGHRRAHLDLEFLDGSGEGFFEAVLTDENLRIWREGFLGVEVMVFCLPLWMAFPRFDLSDADWERRDEGLLGFQRVVDNFCQTRKEAGVEEPVRTLLALTMADDGRSALDTLRERWIEPYRRDPKRVLSTLRKSSGAARYLANARRVSQAVREEFREAPEARVARLPSQLDLGAGEPWIVPLSAIDGDRLAVLEDNPTAHPARRRLSPPIPLHVELPLLVALCTRSNALM